LSGSNATQQAFLEAHELAFAYFGGVFRKLRYDNFTSAVIRHRDVSEPQPNTRLMLFIEAESFCSVGSRGNWVSCHFHVSFYQLPNVHVILNQQDRPDISAEMKSPLRT
jgi:hypothetical protein